MERLICIVIGYLFGLIQTGFIIGKVKRVDIRNHGSGNAGTTNAIRTFGWTVGLLTFLGDCLKCVLAVAVVKWIYGANHDAISLLSMYTGMGVVLGHNYPFYLKFKGGKGIAATAGLILSTNFIMFLSVASVFGAIVIATGYVSLGSLVIMLLFLIEVIIYGQNGVFYLTTPQLYELYAVVIFLVILAFARHRENIKRLIKGTENKLGSKKIA